MNMINIRKPEESQAMNKEKVFGSTSNRTRPWLDVQKSMTLAQRIKQ